MIWIDHVVLGVRDLDEAGERLWKEFGLASAPGGKHPGWGTANRIVPLRNGYVELLGVIDPEVAARSGLGHRLVEEIATASRFIGWCCATDDIESVAGRLGLPVSEGRRVRPDVFLLA